MPHALTSNLIHCVFSTKGRADLIPDPAELGKYLSGIARVKHFSLIISGGTHNHMHLLIALPAAMTLSKAVQDLKGNSSRWLNMKNPGFAWQEGYGGFSVSQSNKTAVMNYISDQRKHHEKRTFEEEFEAMVRKSEIAYDARYIFG